MIGAAGKQFATAGERLGQFPIKVALVQFLLGQSASRFFVAPNTNGKHQALALLQIRLHNNRWVHFTFLLRDRHSERRHTICPYDSKTYMLLSTRDDRTQATWNKGHLTCRCRILRADFEPHPHRYSATPGIRHMTDDGGTIEMGEAGPVTRSIRCDEHGRTTITYHSIRADRLIRSRDLVPPDHVQALHLTCSLKKTLTSQVCSVRTSILKG